MRSKYLLYIQAERTEDSKRRKWVEKEGNEKREGRQGLILPCFLAAKSTKKASKLSSSDEAHQVSKKTKRGNW